MELGLGIAVDRYSSNARGLAIWFALVSTLAIFLLLPFSKITFVPAGLYGFVYIFAVCLLASIYCWIRKMLRLAPALEALALGIFMTIPILVSTYLAISLDMPLMDGPLMHADAALGFDWTAFIAFVDEHPLLAHLLAQAYGSFGIQLLILPLILGATGRYGRAYMMIVAYGVLCYVSSIVSIWFPALGTYTLYGVTQDQLHNINAHYGFAFLHDFNAVRAQPEFVLSVVNASGIITFPSVHAAVALLCAWAAWDVKPIRYVFAAWNGLMALSAVSHANHYLVDVIAGLAISAISIFAVTNTLRLINQTGWSIPMLSFRPVLILLRKQKPATRT